MKKIIFTIGLIAFIAVATKNAQQLKLNQDNFNIKLDQNEIRLKSLQEQMLEVNQQLDAQKGSNQQNKAKIDQLEQEKLQLEKDLQSKRDKQEQDRLAQAQLQQASQKATGASVAQASAGATDAKMFIYTKESGNNPAAVNRSSGACGLGQALPCSKMPCSLSDYACQDNYFTSYMLARYGSWENAVVFWQSHNWW